jgi:hypothetical protein
MAAAAMGVAVMRAAAMAAAVTTAVITDVRAEAAQPMLGRFD